MIKTIYRRLRNLDVIEDLKSQISGLQRILELERSIDFQRLQEWNSERVELTCNNKDLAGHIERLNSELGDAARTIKIMQDNIDWLRANKAKLMRENTALKSSAPTVRPILLSATCGTCEHIEHFGGYGECAFHGCGCKRKTAFKAEPS